MLSRVWALRAAWTSYQMIARDWAIHAYTHAWANWANDETGSSTQHTGMFAGCELYSIAYLHIHVSRGWAMGYKWAISWSVWRVKNYDTDRDQRVALLSIWHWLRWGVRLPIRPSISFPIVRSVYFPIIRCLWPGFCFGLYIMFSCSLGITHHSLVHCKFSVP